ncbi:MAG: homoserine dehydrogenase, partial [Candidatus Omnitrophota bacterium]
IFGASKKYNTPILFEASVGGGIPIIKALREGFVSNKIDSVYGIINGTCNYILSKMSDEGITFRAALRSAQKMGVAEANPSLDIKGIDSAHKLAILAMLGFKVLPDMKQIYCEGILDIEPCDIKYAREMGYEIKLLAIAKKSADKVEARVHPTLIAKEHLLANVKGVYNAIYVKGDLIGESLFYGKGAGKQPTASAVVSDIVDLARGCSQPPLVFSQGAGRIKQVGEIKSKFYIRFSAIDKPGVLSSISGILSKYNISISSVTQKQERREKVVPIVMMTHMAQEKNLQKALKAVNALPTIRKKSVAIRMETL